MLHTLRARLVLSHVLPLLIILPLAGLALVYFLERQVLLESLSKDLAEEATLVAAVGYNQEDVWRAPGAAQALVGGLHPHLTADIMLLDASGVVLATTNEADARLVGRPVDLADLAAARSGQTVVRTTYSRSMRAEIISTLTPVANADGDLVGFVRLSHRLTGVYEHFIRLRLLVGAIVLAGLLIGAAVGWFLASSLERPLGRVTRAVDHIARGEGLDRLPENGPDEIRVLLRAVNSLVERLHSMEQARRQLLANLVHELGRPLGALQSATQALLHGADQDAVLQRELLVGMSDEVGRLRHVLDDLAHLHDQVLGIRELDRRPVDLAAWLPLVLAPWREAAHQKGLDWQVRIPDELPGVEIDGDRLGQAVGNLVSNAIKYTPSGGSVAVSAGRESSSAWIRVGDSGPGIGADEQRRIFDPFYRGRSRTRFPQGMGLGLTIARDVVAAHGGRLELDSAPGAGSRFTIWLPANGHDAPPIGQ